MQNLGKITLFLFFICGTFLFAVDKKDVNSELYSINISVDESSLYVGEETILIMTLKYRKDIELVNIELKKPVFNDFWSKQLATNDEIKDDIYNIQELSFILFPQKYGTLSINAFEMDLAFVDNSKINFSTKQDIKKVKIHSNDLKIIAKPLPKDISLYGDFSVKMTVDKTQVKYAQEVLATVEIEGRGNIDDLDEISIYVDGATIYDNISKKVFDIKQGKYGGKYTKSFSIIPSLDFVLEGVEVKYFDRKTKKIKTIKSKPIEVKVIKDKNNIYSGNTNPVLQTNIDINSKDIKTIEKIVYTQDNQKILFYIYGAFSAFLFFILYLFLRFLALKISYKKDENSKLVSELLKTKNKQKLLKKLLPYLGINSKLDKLAYDLEVRIGGISSIKKEIIKIIKELKI